MVHKMDIYIYVICLFENEYLVRGYTTFLLLYTLDLLMRALRDWYFRNSLTCCYYTRRRIYKGILHRLRISCVVSPDPDPTGLG